MEKSALCVGIHRGIFRGDFLFLFLGNYIYEVYSVVFYQRIPTQSCSSQIEV